jgi:hypothetical protein
MPAPDPMPIYHIESCLNNAAAPVLIRMTETTFHKVKHGAIPPVSSGTDHIVVSQQVDSALLVAQLRVAREVAHGCQSEAIHRPSFAPLPPINDLSVVRWSVRKSPSLSRRASMARTVRSCFVAISGTDSPPANSSLSCRSLNRYVGTRDCDMAIQDL